MKNSILLIVGLFSVISLPGQNYFPIVEENKEWNVMYVIFPGPGSDTLYWTNTYKFEGDTIINNLNYHKVFKSEEEIPITWTLEGCIREDQNKKVYFNKWGNDYLKYDFGCEIGDTIDVYDNNYPTQVLVESIDSINIQGDYRKSIMLKYVGYNTIYEQWIEGIGSNRGILESGTAGYVGGWRWFLCMSKNGELIYMNPNYNSCYLVTTGIKEMNDLKIETFPNPVKDKLTIKTTDPNQINTITITDLLGHKIKNFVYNSPVLDMSGLSSGIYILRLQFENRVIVRKIIIE